MTRRLLWWGLLAALVAGCGPQGAATAPAAPPPAPDAASAPRAAPTAVWVTVAASTAPADRAARRRAAARYEAAHPHVTVAFVDSRDLVGHRDRFAEQLLTAMTDEVDVYEVDVDAADDLAEHTLDVGDAVAAAGGRVDPAARAALGTGGGLLGVPLGRGRALLVSRYSNAPAVAVDVALALAGLDTAADGEEGAG